MDILLIVDRLGKRVKGSIAELCHLLLTEGLPLLGEQQGELFLVQMSRVLRVQGPEGRQKLLVRRREELLLENYPLLGYDIGR